MSVNPPGSQYTIDEYQILLFMEEEKRLLVEGVSDKHLFDLLVDELMLKVDNCGRSVIVETSDLIETQGLLEDPSIRLGCREKVERICEILKNDINSHKLLGFVDREFRGFTLSNSINDNIGQHYSENRILWTRGHSIENYFFNRNFLRYAIRHRLTKPWFNKAISVADCYFEPLIKLACAVSLAAKDLGKLSKAGKSLDWKMLEVDNEGQLFLDVEKWEINLTVRQRLNSEEAKNLIQKYDFWVQQTRSISFDIARWLCHGHIGFKFILCLFAFSVSKAHPEHEKSEKKISQIEDEEYFSIFANAWIKGALQDQCEHPLDALRSLGLDVFSPQEKI